MNKKLFLGMGTIASVVGPIVAVVSCGTDEATNVGTSTETKEATETKEEQVVKVVKEVQEVQVGTYEQLPGISISDGFTVGQEVPQTRTELESQFKQLVYELSAWGTYFKNKGTAQHVAITNAEIDAISFQARLEKSEFNKLSTEEKAHLADQIREFQKHVTELKEQLSFDSANIVPNIQ